MPTTTIATPLTDPRFHRRVAKQLSFWWRGHGADLNHVITRFVPTPDGSVYSGPFPLAGLPDRPAAPFALVSCVLAQQRSAGFKREYARRVREVVGPEVPPDRVFVSFYPSDPADHFTPDSSAWTAEYEESR
jgi:hypothetical protein